MAPLKVKPADEFRVPSLAESSTEYASLVGKRDALNDRYRELNAERSKLSGEIEAEKAAGGQRLSPGVAALLGDSPDTLTVLSARLREVATETGNIETALEILRRRIEEARGRASAIVCATVRSEYDRRLGVLCKLLTEVQAARQSHDELLDDLDREDVEKSYLKPAIPFFLGDRRDGHIPRFMREVAENGHNV